MSEENKKEEPVVSPFSATGEIDAVMTNVEKSIIDTEKLAALERINEDCPNCSHGHSAAMFPLRELEHVAAKLEEAHFWLERARQLYVDHTVSIKSKKK
jgi:hypothetical protein